MVIDGHVHVWADDPATYPWRPIHGASPPSIEGSAELVLSVLDAHGVEAAVAVQPRVYGDDHRYLADALRRFPGRFAAVAALDPRDPWAPRTLSELADAGFVGLRLDPLGWGDAPLVDGTVLPLWDAAVDRDLVVEVMILPSQLAALRPLIERTPSTAVVIEHAARYLAGPDEPLDAVCELATLPNVLVKISALAAISADEPPHRDLWPLLETLCRRFGPERLLWGSDLPWIGADGYGAELATVAELPWLDEAGRQAVLGATAARVFGLQVGARRA
jgi:predicted TIM-barrel fold metal-dependent hydrolase